MWAGFPTKVAVEIFSSAEAKIEDRYASFCETASIEPRRTVQAARASPRGSFRLLGGRVFRCRPVPGFVASPASSVD